MSVSRLVRHLHYGHSNNPRPQVHVARAVGRHSLCAVDLDPAAVDRVLRRASDLSAAHPDTPQATQAMSEEVVVAAAAEVGIPADLVRVSLAIERLGPLPTPRRRRLGGPDQVAVDRVVDVDVDTALARIDELLVRQHQLRRERGGPGRGEWGRRRGVAGTVLRTLKQLGGDAGLRRAERVVAVASPVDGRRCAVRVVVDRSRQRSGVLGTGAAVTGAGLAGVGVLAALTAPVALAASPAALAAGAAVARHGSRQAALAGRELDCLLDAVERAARPASIARDVRAALRSTRSR